MSGWALMKASSVGWSAFRWGELGAPARPCHHSMRVAPVPTTSAGATVVDVLASAVTLAADAVADPVDALALEATETTLLLDAILLPAAVVAGATDATALEVAV